MKKIRVVWKKVEHRERVNPRKVWDDVEGKNVTVYDYLETLECQHIVKLSFISKEPTARRRGCEECRAALRKIEREASEAQAEEVEHAREIAQLEKRVADRTTLPELVEEYFRDLKAGVARAEDAWRRHANLSDTMRGAETYKSLRDGQGYNSLETLASGIENALDSMRQGHDREKERREDEAKLNRMRAFDRAAKKAEETGKVFEVYRHDGDHGDPAGDIEGHRGYKVVEVGTELPRGWVFHGLARPGEKVECPNF